MFFCITFIKRSFYIPLPSIQFSKSYVDQVDYLDKSSEIIAEQVTQLSENINQIATDFDNLVNIAVDINDCIPDIVFCDDKVNKENQ